MPNIVSKRLNDMRHILINTLLILSCIFLFVVVLRALSPVTLNLGYNVHDGYGYGEPDQGEEGNVGWINAETLTAFASIVMAVFSGLLFRVTSQQKALLERSTKTADDALVEARKASEEAKRSTDSYIEGERGRLIVVGAHYDSATNRIEIGFKNFGRGPIVITGDEHRWYITPFIPPFFAPEPIGGRKIPLLSGQVFATWQAGGSIGLIDPIVPDIPVTQRPLVGTSVNLCLQGQVTYHSHMGDRYRLIYSMDFDTPFDGTTRHVHRLFIGADNDGVNDAYNREEPLGNRTFLHDRKSGPEE